MHRHHLRGPSHHAPLHAAIVQQPVRREDVVLDSVLLRALEQRSLRELVFHIATSGVPRLPHVVFLLQPIHYRRIKKKKKREKELASPTVCSRRVRGIAGEEVASASA